MDTFGKSLVRFFTSSNGWSVLLCAMGTVSILLPWCYASHAGTKLWHAIDALACWQSVVVPLVFGVAFLLFIATFSTDSLSWWRIASQTVVAGTAMVVIGLYAGQGTEKLAAVMLQRGAVMVIDPISFRVGPGFYLAAVASSALLLLSALQARSLLFRSRMLGRGESRSENVPASHRM